MKRFKTWLENEYHNKNNMTILDWANHLGELAYRHRTEINDVHKLINQLETISAALPEILEQENNKIVSKEEFTNIINDILGNHMDFDDPINQLLDSDD